VESLEPWLLLRAVKGLSDGTLTRLVREFAPLDWVAVEPVLVLPLPVLLSKNARHPNAARLFIDFALSKNGQEMLRDKGRIPARSDVIINPPELMKKDWKVEIIGLNENLTNIVREYADLFELSK